VAVLLLQMGKTGHLATVALVMEGAIAIVPAVITTASATR
jgi:hypothetical protein